MSLSISIKLLVFTASLFTLTNLQVILPLMFAPFISLGLLGLLAVDPIGIAALTVILVQKHRYIRSFSLLAGSFVSLMALGTAFAFGLGKSLIHFEHRRHWFVPTIEFIAALILIGIAVFIFWEMKQGKVYGKLSDSIINRLKRGNLYLFFTGVILVAVQSVIDIVFVVAMIRVGQLHLGSFKLVLAIATYAVAALLIQLGVILAYRLSPVRHRKVLLDSVNSIVNRFSDRVLIVISTVLGILLLIDSVIKFH